MLETGPPTRLRTRICERHLVPISLWTLHNWWSWCLVLQWYFAFFSLLSLQLVSFFVCLLYVLIFVWWIWLYVFIGSEEEVKDRASQWDQPVSEYIQLAESYLGFQHPGSVYGFNDAGNGCKRVSVCFYPLYMWFLIVCDLFEVVILYV